MTRPDAIAGLPDGGDRSPAALAEQPVFVVGSGRSGTSIFTLALRNGAGLEGFGEGHVLDAWPLLADAVDRFYRRKRAALGTPRHAIGHVSPDDMKADLVAMLLDRMDRLHGGTRWLDKTGGAPMLDFIAAAAGTGRRFTSFFLHRRAIENVVSRLKKFPQHDLAYHAVDWAKTMARWREVRALLPEGSFLEVEQRDLTERPDTVAVASAALLGIPDCAGPIADVFRNRRSQQLASDKVGRVLSLDALDWTESDKAAFMEAVDPEMRAWGYSYDERYRAG